VDAVREGRVRVAVDESGAIIGFSVDEIARDRTWELADLCVEPALMRRGVGTALVADAAERARVAGVARIAVTANPHAVGFYERVGFADTGELVPTRFTPGRRMVLHVR
jgi:ribosomal protein S18 acetylase RimI-like enzyme